MNSRMGSCCGPQEQIGGKNLSKMRVASGLEVTTEQRKSSVDLRFKKLLRIFDRVPGITLMPKSYPMDPCPERHLLLFKINENVLC
jgi:hypothetical protein